MTFQELVQEVKRLRFEETRGEAENYLEFVVDAASVGPLQRVLDAHFGPAFKPAGKNPSKEAKKFSEKHGGIESNQVMYYVERDSISHCALLWPWGNGKSMTVKLAEGVVKK
jgi:hypothetical protein